MILGRRRTKIRHSGRAHGLRDKGCHTSSSCIVRGRIHWLDVLSWWQAAEDSWVIWPNPGANRGNRGHSRGSAALDTMIPYPAEEPRRGIEYFQGLQMSFKSAINRIRTHMADYSIDPKDHNITISTTKKQLEAELAYKLKIQELALAKSGYARPDGSIAHYDPMTDSTVIRSISERAAELSRSSILDVYKRLHTGFSMALGEIEAIRSTLLQLSTALKADGRNTESLGVEHYAASIGKDTSSWHKTVSLELNALEQYSKLTWKPQHLKGLTSGMHSGVGAATSHTHPPTANPLKPIPPPGAQGVFGQGSGNVSSPRPVKP